MRISDWSSDVCSSDLGSTRPREPVGRKTRLPRRRRQRTTTKNAPASRGVGDHRTGRQGRPASVLFLLDRKSVVYGKSVSVRVDLGGRRIIKNKQYITHLQNTNVVTIPLQDII